jgi:hypothetical protein
VGRHPAQRIPLPLYFGRGRQGQGQPGPGSSRGGSPAGATGGSRQAGKGTVQNSGVRAGRVRFGTASKR